MQFSACDCTGSCLAVRMDLDKGRRLVNKDHLRPSLSLRTRCKAKGSQTTKLSSQIALRSLQKKFQQTTLQFTLIPMKSEDWWKSWTVFYCLFSLWFVSMIMFSSPSSCPLLMGIDIIDCCNFIDRYLVERRTLLNRLFLHELIQDRDWCVADFGSSHLLISYNLFSEGNARIAGHLFVNSFWLRLLTFLLGLEKDLGMQGFDFNIALTTFYVSVSYIG